MSTCERHGEWIIAEPGGPDMPTIHGRYYCPTCQAELMAVLDSSAEAAGGADHE